MKKNSEPSLSNHKNLIIFFAIAILTCIISSVYLLTIPADQKNSIFLGYSFARLLIAAIFIVAALIFLVLILSAKTTTIKNYFSFIIGSIFATFIAALALLIAIASAIWTIPGITNFNLAYTERIRPVILWIILISAELLVYQFILLPQSLRDAFSDIGKSLRKFVNQSSEKLLSLSCLFQKPVINIILLLVLSLPILMQNAIRYKFPMGVSGLYALMAEGIQENYFRLPYEVPFYGPGGIPFAYPPLAFYVMAFFTGVLGIDPMIYMRFAAPLYSLIALIPMYLLAKRITSSSIIATIAALLLATYARIYLIQGQAAGLARTLGFHFALTGLYFFYQTITIPNWRDSLFAGLFFGLSILTHPTYGEFFAVAAIAFTLGGPMGKCGKFIERLRQAAIVLAAGMVVSSPWWLTVITRYGSHLLAYAFQSHDSLAFVSLIINPSFLPTLISDFMYKVNKTPIIAGPATLGFFYLLVKRNWTVPLWFVLYIFFFGGYDFLVIPITAIMASIILFEIGKLVYGSNHNTNPIAASLFFIIIISLSYYSGYKSISKYVPDLSGEIFQMAEWFQNNTPVDATFLRVSGSSEEPEWYPYLLRRTPVIASWGSEWTGDYKRQYGAVNQIAECGINQSLACVEDTTNNLNVKPQYLIIDAGQEKLANELLNSSEWLQVYHDARYEVWGSKRFY